jgi:hypothetical protein
VRFAMLVESLDRLAIDQIDAWSELPQDANCG